MTVCGAIGVAGVTVGLIGLATGRVLMILAGIAAIITAYAIAARLDESHR
ncbi:hypothetical protein FB566_2367 [Stackebrandtia endophytica]|uniref:Uncharacterized protein n=1 Tax=Stackebrandtia endophytica TaxID=1496996 RepID=A0A543AW62_9ACTN|nr:hypothetical protein [Stackebrandtia endophytica]TQL76827.1 hypothetical protein FB566_2367 [Stackebrandtia endophytica]